MRFTKPFGDKTFWKTVLPLAIPISLQNLLTSSFGIVDNIMVGSLGEAALAGVGMSTQWTFLFNIAMFGFTSGAAVFFAQYWGIEDRDGIKHAFSLSALCASLVSIMFMAVSCLAPDAVIWMFTKNKDGAFVYGVDYLRVAGFSYIALALTNIVSTLMRSTEKPRMPLYVSLVTVFMNAGFNAFFIYTLDMGVAGAAIATVISAWAGLVMLIIMGAKSGYSDVMFTKLRKAFSWPAGFVKKYFVISTPVFFNEFLWALGTMCLNMVYSNRDETFYAAVTAARSVESLLYAFFVGLCHACAVMVGKRVGMHDREGAARDAGTFMRTLPSFAALVGLILIVARPGIIALFPNLSLEVKDYINWILLIYALETGVRNIPYICIVGIFRAGGDTRVGLIYDIANLWCVSVPVTFILGSLLKLPLVPVYLAMLLSEDVVKSILCVRRVMSGKWYKPVTEARE